MSAEYLSHHEIESTHPDFLVDLSEAEQESLAGGFFMFFNQREIYTNASNQTNYLGSVTPSGGSENSTATGNFRGSSKSSYYFREINFLFSDSSQMSFYQLPTLLRWLFMMSGGRMW